MPTNINPSSLLAECLASFSRAAYQAFAELENQAQQDVAQATSDAHEARRERDKAVDALSTARIEVEKIQKEVASINAALKQEELTVAHQKETLAQLRREATQWKDQSRNWQEHFLRVEQERCSLVTRIEELVAEKLRHNMVPFNSNHSGITTASLFTSKRAFSPSFSQQLPPRIGDSQSPPDVDSSPNSSTQKLNRILTKSTKTPKRDVTGSDHEIAEQLHTYKTPPSPRHTSRSTLIRRVHAVVDVKQEESDEEIDFTDHRNSRRTSHGSSGLQVKPYSPRKRRMTSSDEYISGDENGYTLVMSDKSYEEHDNEQEIDDDDDELMLGADDVQIRAKASKQTLRVSSDSTSHNKKRKLTGHKPTRRKP